MITLTTVSLSLSVATLISLSACSSNTEDAISDGTQKKGHDA